MLSATSICDENSFWRGGEGRGSGLNQLRLMPKFVEIKQMKAAKLSYLNTLINRQNKPLVDVLEGLKEQGYSISHLTKMSNEELRDISIQLREKEKARTKRMQLFSSSNSDS